MRGMAEWTDHLNRAIDHFGSQKLLADAIGCSQAKISWLVVSKKRISAEDALAIERATEGAVAAADLRPDLWPQREISEPLQAAQ